MAYDLTDDILLRFAVARVMTRPDYNDDRATHEPEPRRAERHCGQSRARSVPREPGGPVDRVVSGCRLDPRRWRLFYKDIKSFITDKPVTEFFNVQSAPRRTCSARR